MTADYTEEYVRSSSAPVDVIRLTPLRDAVPQHDDASIWSFHAPVILSLIARIRVPGFTVLQTCAFPRMTGVTAGLMTDFDFPCRKATDYIDRLLGLHQDAGMAVETWGSVIPHDDLPPSWWYTLLPIVNRLDNGKDDWPVEEPDDITIRTAGHVHPNPAHTWPTHPYAGLVPLEQSTYMRNAVTTTPPPRSPYTL